jgi:MFS family permease
MSEMTSSVVIAPRAVKGWRFAKFWGACATANLADGLLLVGLPLLATHLTRSPAAVGLVLMAGRLPWVLLALPAGVLVDRVDRRRLMVVAAVARAGALAGLAWLVASGHVGVGGMAVIAFCMGIGELLFDTSAQTLLPEIAEPHELSRSNGYLQAGQLGMNELVGPAIGGLLAAAALVFPLGAAALLFLLSSTIIASMPGGRRPIRPRRDEPLRTELVSGLRFIWRRPVLRVFACTGGLLNIALGATFAALPLFAVAPGAMGMSPSGYGLLLAGVGVGGMLIAPMTQRLQDRVGTHRLLLAGVAGLAVGCLVPLLTARVVPVALALTVAGATLVVWNVVTVSLRQEIVPGEVLGRVNGSYRLLVYGGLPLGSALGGALGAVAGLRAVFALAGALALLTAIPTWLVANADGIAAARAEGP